MSRLNNGSIQWLRRRKRSNRVDISLDLKLPDLRGQLQSAIYQLRPNQNQTFRGLGLSHAKRYIRVESTWLVKAWLIKKTKKKAAAAAVVVCIFWGASVCKYKRWEGLMGRGDSASLGPARPGTVSILKSRLDQMHGAEWIRRRESGPSGPSGGESAADLWRLHPTEACWLIRTSTGPEGPITCVSTRRLQSRLGRGLLNFIRRTGPKEKQIWCFIWSITNN